MGRIVGATLVLVVATAGASLAGSFRRDTYLDKFPEGTLKPPSGGGRVHLVLSGITAGTFSDTQLTSVLVNGQEAPLTAAAAGGDITYFDWFRAHLNSASGELWCSFHTRNTNWIGDGSSAAFDVSATFEGGATFNGSVSIPLALPPVELTYVTTRQKGAEVLIHLHASNDAGVHNLTLNGMPVPLPAAAASLPKGGHLVVNAMGHLRRTQKNEFALLGTAPGDVWTVTFRTDQSIGPVAYGGRHLPERFPIEAWPKSDECALPGANDDNFEKVHKNFVVDSLFFTGGSGFRKKCGGDLNQPYFCFLA